MPLTSVRSIPYWENSRFRAEVEVVPSGGSGTSGTNSPSVLEAVTGPGSFTCHPPPVPLTTSCGSGGSTWLSAPSFAGSCSMASDWAFRLPLDVVAEWLQLDMYNNESPIVISAAMVMSSDCVIYKWSNDHETLLPSNIWSLLSRRTDDINLAQGWGTRSGRLGCRALHREGWAQ
jgi:hypothetical protein